MKTIAQKGARCLPCCQENAGVQTACQLGHIEAISKASASHKLRRENQARNLSEKLKQAGSMGKAMKGKAGKSSAQKWARKQLAEKKSAAKKVVKQQLAKAAPRLESSPKASSRPGQAYE
ncbi:MAG: hypothetical protein HC888_15755 [Candidatus Competibacteraceae bacterium]|nr:hypothetical protein [Candidatus Competibacteraceae bacterium]